MPVGMAARQTQAENPACGSRKALKIKSLSREDGRGPDNRHRQASANATSDLIRIKRPTPALGDHRGIPTCAPLPHGHHTL